MSYHFPVPARSIPGANRPGLGLMFMAPAGARKNPSSRNDRNSLTSRLGADAAIFPNAISLYIRLDYLSFFSLPSFSRTKAIMKSRGEVKILIPHRPRKFCQTRRVNGEFQHCTRSYACVVLVLLKLR